MTNTVISVPGEQDARTYGPYKVVLSLTVDEAFSINVFAATGGHRYDALCHTTADVHTANLIHRVIREGGEQGVSAEGIREALDAALRQELFQVQARRDTPSRDRIEHINAVLDRLEQPADTARMDELAADLVAFASKVGDAVAAGVSDHARPKTFRELRDAHQAGINRQRAEVR
ncbi:hypothetical protein [Micromonospora profundi]|uniref:hypothetical protein n=1 Tax=Micromonospora profundi TaxID=1420889 RepID=UPI003659275C